MSRFRIQNDQLDMFKYRYSSYINDPMFVYKLCNNKWLVIMKKLTDENSEIKTITNETRDNIIDPLYAKFRANLLKVILILNVENGNIINFITNSYPDKTLCTESTVLYEIDKLVISEKFDNDLNKICTHGIHYFKSIEGAFFYRQIPLEFSGTWIRWYENGQRFKEFEIKNGNLHGFYTDWHENKIIQSEGNYINGAREGHWTFWHDNGKRESEGRFHLNKKEGYWTFWYSNGQKNLPGDMKMVNKKVCGQIGVIMG